MSKQLQNVLEDWAESKGVELEQNSEHFIQINNVNLWINVNPGPDSGTLNISGSFGVNGVEDLLNKLDTIHSLR